MYNLEYRILDKLGRTKKTLNVGIFSTDEKLELAKTKVIEDNKEDMIAFDVYAIDLPIFKTV